MHFQLGAWFVEDLVTVVVVASLWRWTKGRKRMVGKTKGGAPDADLLFVSIG